MSKSFSALCTHVLNNITNTAGCQKKNATPTSARSSGKEEEEEDEQMEEEENEFKIKQLKQLQEELAVRLCTRVQYAQKKEFAALVREEHHVFFHQLSAAHQIQVTALRAMTISVPLDHAQEWRNLILNENADRQAILVKETQAQLATQMMRHGAQLEELDQVILKHDREMKQELQKMETLLQMAKEAAIVNVFIESCRYRGKENIFVHPLKFDTQAATLFFKGLERHGYAAGLDGVQDLLHNSGHYTVGFHGTKTIEAVCGILQNGFDTAKRGETGQNFGTGEYFDLGAGKVSKKFQKPVTDCDIVTLIITKDKKGKALQQYREATWHNPPDSPHPICVVNNPEPATGETVPEYSLTLPMAVASSNPLNTEVVLAITALPVLPQTEAPPPQTEAPPPAAQQPAQTMSPSSPRLRALSQGLLQPPFPLAVGQKVMYKGKEATVKFRGETGFAPGVWVGLEMATSGGGVGLHDGRSNVDNVRYFECPKGHGVFVLESQVHIVIF